MSTHTIPASQTAGDSFAATLSGDTYPASAGWVAQLLLIGGTRYTLSATASGSAHAVAANAAATAAWVPGAYQLRAVYTLGADRYSLDVGRLQVLPDPAATTTDATALKGPAQRVLEALEAVYATFISTGQFTVGEYTINGRAVKYRSVEELRRAINAARRDAAAEQAAAGLLAGESRRQRLVIRM